MPSSTDIARNIQQIRQKIATLATKYGRSEQSIQLLAVSKTKPVSDIVAAYQEGQRAFGENYLQEALEKIEVLEKYDIEWHFIGSIQSNKTRDIANNFQWVHSVDRVKIASRLNQQRNPELPPLNICLQVNISHESSKAGFSPDDLAEATKLINQLPHIQLRGLMAIPAKAESLEDQRLIFKQMKQLLDQLNQQGLAMDSLSMGMSNDMEAAIAEGATIIRLGTAIFGPRTQN